MIRKLCPRLLCQHPSRPEKGPPDLLSAWPNPHEVMGTNSVVCRKSTVLRIKDWGTELVPKLAWVLGSSSIGWGLDNVISKSPFQLQSEFKWLEVFWEMVQKLK